MKNDLSKNGRERQRLAWSILLGSFAACMVITVAIPLSVRAYLQNATDFLTVTVQANQGTVSIDDDRGSQQSVRAGQPGQNIAPGASILTDATATALLSVYPPESEQLLSRLQVYGNTNVTLQQAETPRFQISDARQALQLELDGGRLRLSVPEHEGRPYLTTITTPQATITIQEPGQYSLSVNNEETQVAVQEGLAHVSGRGYFIDLLPDERSVIPTDDIPSAPLPTERNLVQNGDFNDRWTGWQQYAWGVELTNQPAGNIDVKELDGEPRLYIRREGEGHADVRIRQLINQNVADFESLNLQLTFQIVGQTLGVCGVQGSECPLFVRINYDDQTGVNRTWQHGFYATGVVSEETPDTCAFCNVVQSAHDPVTMGQLYFYDVDLIDDLARQGVPPINFIESMELVASGHSFEVEIVEVALLANE